MSKAVLQQNGTKVDLVIDGAIVATLPWQKANELARGLLAQAKRAEEWECAERIASDQALLLRSGVPIGLTEHPAIQAEAAKRAAWDRDLRRYLPGGVKAQSIVGIPAVRHS